LAARGGHDEGVKLGRDEIANMTVSDARETVRFLDDAEEITADGDEGGLFLLALGVLALDQQKRELQERLRRHGLTSSL
jgi:hypothetical protein